MKTQTQTSKTINGQVNSLVGEQVEKTINIGQVKTFGSVDLWNIQRQRKSILIR